MEPDVEYHETGYPEFGTAPIKCANCGVRGFETELEIVDGKSTCPECGCNDYYFLTSDEVAEWEWDKAHNAEVTSRPSSGD